MPVHQLPEFVSVQTAARRLDMTEEFVRSAIRRGDLAAVKVKREIRIPVHEFVAWVDSITKPR